MTGTDRLRAARRFLAAHARVLDRRRFERLFDGADAKPVLAALGAYRASGERNARRSAAPRPPLGI